MRLEGSGKLQVPASPLRTSGGWGYTGGPAGNLRVCPPSWQKTRERSFQKIWTRTGLATPDSWAWDTVVTVTYEGHIVIAGPLTPFLQRATRMLFPQAYTMPHYNHYSSPRHEIQEELPSGETDSPKGKGSVSPTKTWSPPGQHTMSIIRHVWPTDIWRNPDWEGQRSKQEKTNSA